MADFNKGDFTQQGVAGDVSALVRLNEKRVMKVVLSSDDESDNCDITGAVTDLLNNEVYPIGAGVSGNIEITENGENINVAPYATATVNVAGGGGDIKTMDITINATEGTNADITIKVPYIDNDGFYHDNLTLNLNETVQIKAPIRAVPPRPGQSGTIYTVGLSITSSGAFTANNTGNNCDIGFDTDYPQNLYIDITDVNEPANASLVVSTGGIS